MAEITRGQLEAVLDHQWVYAANRDGTHHGQVVNPVKVAEELWEKLTAPGDPPAPAADHLADAAQAVTASTYSYQRWGGGEPGAYKSAMWEMKRAQASALIAIAEALQAGGARG